MQKNIWIKVSFMSIDLKDSHHISGSIQEEFGIFIGDENDTKLDLGKCLLAWNKVHALHLLGFPNNYILFYIDPLNFLQLAADQNLDNRYINQVIKSYFNENGPTEHFIEYDRLDFPMTSIAKSRGYDTIMLVAEDSAKSSELIDLRTEVTPKSLEDHLKDIDVDAVMKDLKKKGGKNLHDHLQTIPRITKQKTPCRNLRQLIRRRRTLQQHQPTIQRHHTLRSS